MSDVAAHFVFLNSEADAIRGTSLLSRAIGLQIAGRDCLVALDGARQRHLLIPVTSTHVAGDHSSQGVSLGARILVVDGVEVPYADLHCHLPQLDLVFERLVEDIVQRLSDHATEVVDTCRRVLDDWRALLRAAGQDIARETIIGLTGELEVLLLLARQNAAAALDAWRGPSRSVHDFVRPGSELEIKTTTSVGGNFVSVSNLAQLDPALAGELHLVVVHLRADDSAGNLDERIDAAIALGVPRATLLSKVAGAGYVYGSGAAADERYRLISIRAWSVGDSFPGLRASTIGEARLKGVSKVHYELALDTAPRRMSDESFDAFVRDWLTRRDA